LLIGRIGWNPPPAPVAATDSGWNQVVIIFAAIVGAIGLGIWVFIPKRVRTVRSENPFAQRSSPHGEVQDWLKAAEAAPASLQPETTDFHFHNN
jgi:hypothetical protein